MKKRILSIIMAFCLIASLLPTVALAADNATISATKNEVKAGETFDVSLVIPNITDKLAYSASFAYSFDNSVFEVVNFSAPAIGDVSADGENSADGNILCTYTGVKGGNTLDFSSGLTITATFKVKDDATPGSYSFVVDEENTFAYFYNEETYEDEELFTIPTDLKTSVTVTEDVSGDEGDSGSTTEAPTYTASVTTDAESNTVVNGQEIIVNVNVGISDFASSNVVMSYDSTKLEYKANSFTSAATDAGNDDQAAEIAIDNGTLTITDFGGTITKGDDVYQVTFKAIDGGQTQVTLESAAFSTQAYAETDNLVKATIDPKSQTVNINHKITVNGTEDGSAAADGTGSYEFTIDGYDPLYDYTVEVTMGNSSVSLENLGGGKYKVENITDDLTITYTKGERNAYGVTWAGNYSDLEDQYKNISSVAVGQNLVIALPAGADAAPDQAGYSYSAVITIGETEHKTMTSGESYTIPSEAITDDITITVTKTTIPALGYNYVTITIPADSGVEIDGFTGTTVTVKEGEAVKLNLIATDTDLYNYSVKMGDVEILNNTTTSCTINPEEDVTITVAKTLKTDSATATKYLELNGKDIYLLEIGGEEKVDGKVYTYTENKETRDMFWSAKYKAYCTLIVVDADTVPVLTAGVEGSIAGNFGIKDGTAEEVDYTMDVNKSGTKDINDAQLVWNMYSNKYQGVTENVTIEKFLRADVNTTVGVDSTDAQAIIG